MQFWIARNSSVPIQEQLATQVMLAIVSNDLRVGTRLPSTRQLARRLSIHWNTVAAVYQDLAARGWLEFKRGSGFYVMARTANTSINQRLPLDKLTLTFLQQARQLGFTTYEIAQTTQKWLQVQPPDHGLVIEADAELRKILILELRQTLKLPIYGLSPAECAHHPLLTGAIPMAIYGRVDKDTDQLPANLVFLRTNSIQQGLQTAPPLPKDTMVVVVSDWAEFLKWAQTILLAAGFESAQLSFRNTQTSDWLAGITKPYTIVITDHAVQKLLPLNCRTFIFSIIAPSSLTEITNLYGLAGEID